MRFTCTGQYPPEECRELILFASCGVGKRGVSVALVPAKRSFSGLTRPDGTIRLRMGPKGTLRPAVPSTRALRRILPTIPCRDWRDVLVFLAAHEFRHLAQYRGAAPACCPRCGEQDAEEHAIRMLNAWRRRTGRSPIAAGNP